ncbi:tetratricopeptide repeat protein [Balneola vulgaris]|uniref:tetratricopeptide repeat protein n=1 Tax=Balneola vulgaris TaxID=287535 RepID=UPI00037217E7|nr:tetratricopeptide repeat protein [Balneola vulgaris]
MSTSNKKDIYGSIQRYIQGQLSEEEIEALWVEFAKDPTLLDRLEIEVGVKKIIQAEMAPSQSKGAKLLFLNNWGWHAAAAVAILLVAVVQVFRVDTPTQLSEFIITGIPLDQVETTDGIRSKKEMIVLEADSLMNLGFAALVNDNKEQALSLFNQVIASYDEEPYASKAYLNRGIIHFNDGVFESAVEDFIEAAERASDNRMISEKAYWYLANTYVNTGQLEKALEAVSEAYKRDGVFRKPALLLYQKLSYDLGNVDYEQAPASLGEKE